jgi:hypothetical protein
VGEGKKARLMAALENWGERAEEVDIFSFMCEHPWGDALQIAAGRRIRLIACKKDRARARVP